MKTTQLQQLQNLLIEAEKLNMNSGYLLGELSATLSDMIDTLNTQEEAA